MRHRAVLPVALLLVLIGPPAAPAGGPTHCERVISVGDLHGAFDSFVAILQSTGLIDEKLDWVGGDTCLLQLGDIVDRGSRSREILDLLMRLAEQAPDKVETLLGNHEVMTILGDLRYATLEEFAAFADEETDEQRARGLEVFQGLQEVFDATFPPGWFARRKAFAPGGQYGAWLLSRPMMLRVDETLYVHGGARPEDARAGIKKLNRRLPREIKEHIRLEHQLIQAGWLSDLTPYDVSLQLVRRAMDESVAGRPGRPSSRATVPVGAAYLTLAMKGTLGPTGPLWNRELARADEAGFEPRLEKVLSALDVRRIVVAHTTTEDFRIRSRFGDRVFVIDTGAGPAYGGQISALEVTPGGLVRAHYRGGSEVLVDPPMTDEWIEAFLRDGTIVHYEEIGTGITRPLRARLELDGQERKAAFNFTDSYRHERAAYLLDRYLGMNMVPVAVLRPLDGTPGAFIDWVSGAMSEADRREQELLPDDPRKLIYQRAVMTVFDVLISNSDRNPANQLITRKDWKLHLIDHSRTFRLVKEIPPSFEEAPLSMPVELLPRIEALDAKLLETLLEDLVSKAQIKALLERRDKLLAKLERDRKEHGDGLVFVSR